MKKQMMTKRRYGTWIERHKLEDGRSMLVERTEMRGGSMSVPLTWNSPVEYIEWMLANWKRLPQKFISRKVERESKELFKKMLVELKK
jgi:hypothetical protein